MADMKKIARLPRYLAAGGQVILKPSRAWSRPIHLILETTTVCPYDCIMCSRSREVSDPKHMEFDFFKSIVDEVDPLYIFFSSAGEPLFHPDQPRMIRHAKEKGIKTCLVTSLTGSAFPMEELVKSGLDLLKVSIDGATEETYKKIRGTDLFPKVLKNIEGVAACKKKLPLQKPFVRFQCVVQKANYREAAALVRLAKKLSVDAVFFKPLGVLRIEDRVDKLMGGVDYGDFKKALGEAKDAAAELGVATNLDDFLSYLLPNIRKVYTSDHGFQPLSRKCVVPWFSVYVRIEGDVSFCCYAKIENAKMGNMTKESFSKIWNSDRVRAMRRTLKKGGFPMPDCRWCVPQKLSHLIDYRRIVPGYAD